MDYDYLYIPLKVTPTTKLFLCNKVFYLKKKQCFLYEIASFLYFCEIHIFQNLCCHHRHCYIMEVTLMVISFESYEVPQ